MKLTYVGPYNTTGYGIASMGYGFGLKHNLKNDFGFKIIGHPDTNSPEANKAYFNDLLSSIANIDYESPALAFWHAREIAQQLISFQSKKIGFTTFETYEHFNLQLKSDLDHLDAIGTASKWGENILRENFPNKLVFSAPHAFKLLESDTVSSVSKGDFVSTWNETIAPYKLPEDTFIVSSAGKWELRKSHPELLDAVLEIGQERPIALVGFWYNPFIPEGHAFSEFIQRNMYPVYTEKGIKVFTKDKATIICMPMVKERERLFSALASANLFIAPSKGEGWNLPLFEMMTFGMPCAATLATAHTHYCTNKNVIPITHGDMVPAKDGKFFMGNEYWHDVTVESIIESILTAIKLGNDQLFKIGAKAAKDLSKYSWDQSGKEILNSIKSLL